MMLISCYKRKHLMTRVSAARPHNEEIAAKSCKPFHRLENYYLVLHFNPSVYEKIKFHKTAH